MTNPEHPQTGIIGTIISTAETPSTEEFAFVLQPATRVQNGDFVQINTSAGKLVALVKHILRQNRYYEFAESISEYSKQTDFAKTFPANDWEYTTATCQVLGMLSPAGQLARCSIPPAPGEKVEPAQNELVETVLGLDKTGVNLGEVMGRTGLAASVNFSRLLQKHLALLGMSGSGKSYLASVLIEELLLREKQHGRVAVVAFDSHGDYTGFAGAGGQLAGKVQLVKPEEMQISCLHLTPTLLSELDPTITAPAKREYAKLFARFKEAAVKDNQTFDLDDLVEAAEQSDSRTNLADTIAGLRDMKLFGKTDGKPLTKIVSPGKFTIFDLSEIHSLQAKQAILAYYAKRLFSMRREAKIPPFLLLVEEAHNFCKEKAKRENAVSKSIIETIAREGRKFGACLCLVSQRPVQLSTTALSQCSTFIVMRVTNPYDLKHIGESCEGIDSSALTRISSLKTGEGIIIGDAANFPTFIKVRKRTTTSLQTGKRLEDLASEYEQMHSELTNEDAKAFL